MTKMIIWSGREEPKELEYKIDFSNGEKIKVVLRNGNLGYIIDNNDEYKEGIIINPKFISMIHEIMTENLTNDERNMIYKLYKN